MATQQINHATKIDIDLENIEELAKKATQGVWVADDGYVSTENSTGKCDDTSICWALEMQPCSKENAEYIAAVNPSVVLRLIHRIRFLENQSKLLRVAG